MLIIIPFLGFFSYFAIYHVSPFPYIQGTFFKYTPRVKYQTFKIYIDESIPNDISENIVNSLKDIQFQGVKRFEFVEKRKGKYTISTDGKIALVSKDLIPVGHIYWIKSSESKENLAGKTVLMEKEENEFAGKYISNMFNVNVKVVNSVIDELKKSEDSIAFIFPSKLNKDLKVLQLDGKYPLEDGETIEVSYFLNGNRDIEFISNIIRNNVVGLDNDVIDNSKIVKINMTGVTAMSRGLGIRIDSSGDFSYPARDIGTFLADADITHTSNEVSFVDGCNVVSGMRFCSKPEYIEVLKKSGIDIIELTGNHNNDFGEENNIKSIEIYKGLGWEYFGGGLNSEDAAKILYKEIKGSKIAFLGYNYYDTMLNTQAIAGKNRAGANSYSESKLKSDIQEANKNADVVIVTFQFQECYSYPPSDVIYPICYKPLSSPDQKGVFRNAIDQGADIVIGTQAHQPQTYEIYKDGSIFYGLGNLYFDQNKWIGTRQGLVLSIYLLEGRVMQTRLIPTIYDYDLIPRVAEKSSADLLLNLLKSARDF